MKRYLIVIQLLTTFFLHRIYCEAVSCLEHRISFLQVSCVSLDRIAGGNSAVNLICPGETLFENNNK